MMRSLPEAEAYIHDPPPMAVYHIRSPYQGCFNKRCRKSETMSLVIWDIAKYTHITINNAIGISELV